MQSTMIIRLLFIAAIATMSVVMAIGDELSCVDDKSFVFVHRNKKGRSKKKKDGCKFAGRKRKKRCRKKMNGVKVKEYCPAACRISRCTGIVSNQRSWLEELSQLAKQRASLSSVQTQPPNLLGSSPFSDQPLLNLLGSSPSSDSSPLSKFYVKWASSIGYNPLVDEAEYSQSGLINNRVIEEGCKNLISTDSSDPSEVFACRLWFPPGKSMQPIAMGPLKMSTNIITSYEVEGYKRSDVTQIFKPYALAAMIKKGCIYFDTGQQVYSSMEIQFSDESSFEDSVKSGSSISVEVEVGYGPIAVNAGYSQSNEASTANNENRKTAYGEKRYFKNIGFLDNLCFSDDRVKTIRSLVKEEWVEKWSFIRNFQGTAQELMKTQQFVDVAKAGLVIPKTYVYGAAISYKIMSSYVYTSSESEEKMERAISAGISGSAGAGSASVSTNVKNTMESNTKNTNLNAKTTVELNVYGKNIDSSCMKDDDCNQEMNEKVDDVVNDFNQIGYPYKADETINLVDFVKNFYHDGKPGFPDVFKEAMEMYYTINECVNPGGGNGCNEFTTTNGAGKKIIPSGGDGSREYCPTNTVCAHAQFFPNEAYYLDRLCKTECTKDWKEGDPLCIDTANMLNGC